MVAYEFRCDRHGSFDVALVMGSAPEDTACPRCGDTSFRVFTAPLIPTKFRSAMAAIDQSEKSRYEPEVVTALPRRALNQRTPLAPESPALQRLPKP